MTTRATSAHVRWYTPALLLIIIGFVVGCVPVESVNTASGYQRLTSEELSRIDQDALRNVQFFTSNALRFSSSEEAVEDSLATEGGRLMKIQTRHQKSIEIPQRTPGVLVELGNNWIDLDVGDGVVLRFRETGNEGYYQCVALNGQPLRLDAPNRGPRAQIEFEGDVYEIAETRPVYLEYFLRRVVNVDRERQTIGGKRLDETRRTAAAR